MPSGIFHERGFVRLALNAAEPELADAVDRLAAAGRGD
jgi:hypothetical protein